MDPKRILIADDDPEVIKVLSILAEKEGYCVVGVNNIIELKSIIEKQSFDLIITDLIAVNPDYASIIDVISESASNIPVIALTGRIHQETKAIEGKFEKVFRKPCNLKELFAYINRVLNTN